MGRRKLLKNQCEITYKISAGIPFRWDVKVIDESIVKYVSKYVLKDENKGSLCGAPVYINYIFEGLTEGETYVIFQLVNFGDNYIDREEKYIAKVDVNKKIKLIKVENY